MWISDKDFPNIVKASWNRSDLQLHEIINDFKNNLVHWNINSFKNIYKQKKKKFLARLSGIQKNPCYCFDDQLRNLEKKNLNDEYLNILKYEEELWMLKSRVTWLSLGDKNNTFFHRSTLIRRRKKMR